MAEAVSYWGNYSNKEIFGLMPRFVYLDLRGCFRLHIIWVAGTRKIAAVIYGFSRGCLTDGMASSGSILDSVPLNETDFESSVLLLSWVWPWIGVNNIKPLAAEGWFKKGRVFKGGQKNDGGI